MDQMMSRARTILICSHNLDTIRDRCQTTIWLERGELRMVGATNTVLSNYENFLETLDEATKTTIQRKAGRSVFSRAADGTPVATRAAAPTAS